jgi:hypothetical protein
LDFDQKAGIKIAVPWFRINGGFHGIACKVHEKVLADFADPTDLPEKKAL